MKKVFTLATALCFVSMSALAHNTSGKSPAPVAAPMVKVLPIVPVAGSAAGSTGVILGVGTIVFVAAALAASGSSTTTTTTN